MNVTVRTTTPEDWKDTEVLTKKAFWNHHVPGCDEHLYLHKIRQMPAFLPELDLVAELDGSLAAHIAYVRSHIQPPAGDPIATVTFGPVSVLPQYQKQGIGTQLINESIKKVEELGFGAIMIMGDPEYYQRFGFSPASHFKIGLPDGKYPSVLQALELQPGYLRPGSFIEDAVFSCSAEELEEFDAGFPPMEKGYTPFQDRFIALSNMFDTL